MRNLTEQTVFSVPVSTGSDGFYHRPASVSRRIQKHTYLPASVNLAGFFVSGKQNGSDSGALCRCCEVESISGRFRVSHHNIHNKECGV